MFNSSELSNELQALRSEVARLLGSNGDGTFAAARDRADDLAEQISTAFNELSETLSEQEDHVEALVAKHPVATMASVLAVGIVIGFLLRRN